MNFVWKCALVALALLLLCVSAASTCLAEPQKAVFSDNEKQLINEYYKQIAGTLAPGSIDRNPLPFNIEQALKIGSRLPKSNRITRLPGKLEAQLPAVAGGYERFRIGNHVVLLKTSDRTVADIIRNAGLK